MPDIPVATVVATPTAIPVKFEPSPRYDVAVTTPVKNPSPSLLRVTPDHTRNEVLSNVRLALAFNVFAVPEPVIILDVPLLFIVVLVTLDKVEPSP